MCRLRMPAITTSGGCVVKLRKLSAMAAGLVLAFGGMAAADDNANLVRIKNQVLANKVAATLQKSGNLHGSSIDVTCVDGVVELSGKVADGSQHDALVSTAVGVSGVKSVI